MREAGLSILLLGNLPRIRFLGHDLKRYSSTLANTTVQLHVNRIVPRRERSWMRWPIDTGDRPILLVHAHPDDEVFAGGAAVAWLSSLGAEVIMRVASGGEVAEGPATNRRDARIQRSARLDQSCEALGISDWNWLSNPGRWIDTGAQPDVQSLSMATLDELCPSVLEAVNDIGPRWLITVGTDGLTGHPDHILIRRAIDVVMQQLGNRAPTVLGSQVRTCDVTAAHQLLSSRGMESAGSGRLVGTTDELDTCVAPDFAGHARQTAYEVYAGGDKNIKAIEDSPASSRPGDSLVLHSVFDVTGWNVDRFEC